MKNIFANISRKLWNNRNGLVIGATITYEFLEKLDIIPSTGDVLINSVLPKDIPEDYQTQIQNEDTKIIIPTTTIPQISNTTTESKPLRITWEKMSESLNKNIIDNNNNTYDTIRKQTQEDINYREQFIRLATDNNNEKTTDNNNEKTTPQNTSNFEHISFNVEIKDLPSNYQSVSNVSRLTYFKECLNLDKMADIQNVQELKDRLAKFNGFIFLIDRQMLILSEEFDKALIQTEYRKICNFLSINKSNYDETAVAKMAAHLSKQYNILKENVLENNHIINKPNDIINEPNNIINKPNNIMNKPNILENNNNNVQKGTIFQQNAIINLKNENAIINLESENAIINLESENENNNFKSILLNAKPLDNNEILEENTNQVVRENNNQVLKDNNNKQLSKNELQELHNKYQHLTFSNHNNETSYDSPLENEIERLTKQLENDPWLNIQFVDKKIAEIQKQHLTLTNELKSQQEILKTTFSENIAVQKEILANYSNKLLELEKTADNALKSFLRSLWYPKIIGGIGIITTLFLLYKFGAHTFIFKGIKKLFVSEENLKTATNSVKNNVTNNITINFGEKVNEKIIENVIKTTTDATVTKSEDIVNITKDINSEKVVNLVNKIIAIRAKSRIFNK